MWQIKGYKKRVLKMYSLLHTYALSIWKADLISRNKQIPTKATKRIYEYSMIKISYDNILIPTSQQENRSLVTRDEQL